MYEYDGIARTQGQQLFQISGEQRPPGLGTACGTHSAGMAATNGGATVPRQQVGDTPYLVAHPT